MHIYLPQTPDESGQDHQTQDQADHDDGDLDQCGGLLGEEGFHQHLEHRPAFTATLGTGRRHQAVAAGGGVEVRAFNLGDGLPLDEDGVRILLSGVQHGHRALQLHDAVATLRQRPGL